MIGMDTVAVHWDDRRLRGFRIKGDQSGIISVILLNGCEMLIIWCFNLLEMGRMTTEDARLCLPRAVIVPDCRQESPPRMSSSFGNERPKKRRVDPVPQAGERQKGVRKRPFAARGSGLTVIPSSETSVILGNHSPALESPSINHHP